MSEYLIRIEVLKEIIELHTKAKTKAVMKLRLISKRWALDNTEIRPGDIVSFHDVKGEKLGLVAKIEGDVYMGDVPIVMVLIHPLTKKGTVSQGSRMVYSPANEVLIVSKVHRLKIDFTDRGSIQNREIAWGHVVLYESH